MSLRFVRPAFCLRLPFDSALRRTPLPGLQFDSLLNMSVRPAGHTKQKGRPRRDAPLMFSPTSFCYGTRSRKNRAASDELTGSAFENAPLTLNVPAVFVVHCAIGAATLVEVSQV